MTTKDNQASSDDTFDFEQETAGILRILQWTANRNEGLITSDIEQIEGTIIKYHNLAVTAVLERLLTNQRNYDVYPEPETKMTLVAVPTEAIQAELERYKA